MDEPLALVCDRRAELAARAPGGRPPPGTHAFIVGVSNYPYLKGGASAQPETYGIGQLTCAATSALRFYEWLVGHEDSLAAPLATCRLLLSPNPTTEPHIPPDCVPRQRPATLDNYLQAVRQWRKDASTNPDDMAIFYFVGHGVQLAKPNNLMLFEDFNHPNYAELHGAADTESVFWGMSPTKSLPKIARTQLFFVDACRTQPNALEKFQSLSATAAFNVERDGPDDRSAPCFFSTLTSSTAGAIPDEETLFNRALINALNKSAADHDGREARWRVTTWSLCRALQRELQVLRQRYGGAQDVAPAGLWSEAALRYFDCPPPVDVQVEIDPDAACHVGQLVVQDGRMRDFIAAPLAPPPYRSEWPAGRYVVNVQFSDATYKDLREVVMVKPWVEPFRFRVT